MREEERILAVLAEALGLMPSELNPALGLDMLFLDSLDKLELVVSLEEAFDISLDDVRFTACDTVEEIVALISAQLHA